MCRRRRQDGKSPLTITSAGLPRPGRRRACRGGQTLITLGGERRDLEAQYCSVTVAGHTSDPYAMDFETNQPIFVLRGPKRPLAEIWPKLKHYW